ncbi:MAG: hypothetical protein ACJ8CB_14595 [Ktedonobacteraceae bacterium]
MNGQHPEEAVINALCTAQPIEGAMAIAWKPCRLMRPSPSYNVIGMTY